MKSWTIMNLTNQNHKIKGTAFHIEYYESNARYAWVRDTNAAITQQYYIQGANRLAVLNSRHVISTRLGTCSEEKCARTA